MSLVLTPVEKTGSNQDTEISETRSDTDACSEGLGPAAGEETSHMAWSGEALSELVVFKLDSG